jgi:hypothetical protein
MSDTLIQFYKMRVGYFYGAQVDQIDFSSILKVIFRCRLVHIICGARKNPVQYESVVFLQRSTLLKKKRKFSSYLEIQKGSGANLYMKKHLLIYKEIRQYLSYQESVGHI